MAGVLQGQWAKSLGTCRKSRLSPALVWGHSMPGRTSLPPFPQNRFRPTSLFSSPGPDSRGGLNSTVRTMDPKCSWGQAGESHHCGTEQLPPNIRGRKAKGKHLLFGDAQIILDVSKLEGTRKPPTGLLIYLSTGNVFLPKKSYIENMNLALFFPFTDG